MITRIPGALAQWIAAQGEMLAVFDEHTQDSGHVSYGVRGADGTQVFIKTAGRNTISPGGRTFSERVQSLRHAARIQLDHPHPAFVPVRQVIEAADGIAVMYDWFPGELLRAPAGRREHPGEAHHRFKLLPANEMIRALDDVIDLHVHLDRNGWVIGDFYDGCLMYDFQARTMKFMDLEFYRHGAYVNTVGRLPGSTRFMAPEESQLGATIDSRTTVFNLARMVQIFLLPRNTTPALTALVERATALDPAHRRATPLDFQRVWRQAAQVGAGVSSAQPD